MQDSKVFAVKKLLVRLPAFGYQCSNTIGQLELGEFIKLGFKILNIFFGIRKKFFKLVENKSKYLFPGFSFLLIFYNLDLFEVVPKCFIILVIANDLIYDGVVSGIQIINNSFQCVYHTFERCFRFQRSFFRFQCSIFSFRRGFSFRLVSKKPDADFCEVFG